MRQGESSATPPEDTQERVFVAFCLGILIFFIFCQFAKQLSLGFFFLLHLNSHYVGHLCYSSLEAQPAQLTLAQPSPPLLYRYSGLCGTPPCSFQPNHTGSRSCISPHIPHQHLTTSICLNVKPEALTVTNSSAGPKQTDWKDLWQQVAGLLPSAGG